MRCLRELDHLGHVDDAFLHHGLDMRLSVDGGLKVHAVCLAAVEHWDVIVELGVAGLALEAVEGGARELGLEAEERVGQAPVLHDVLGDTLCERDGADPAVVESRGGLCLGKREEDLAHIEASRAHLCRVDDLILVSNFHGAVEALDVDTLAFGS